MALAPSGATRRDSSFSSQRCPWAMRPLWTPIRPIPRPGPRYRPTKNLFEQRGSTRSFGSCKSSLGPTRY